MQVFDLFYKWVPLYIKLPVLLILLFATLVANGVFLGNTTDMYSSMGVYTEPFTQAYNAMYIGMGLGMVITVRLKMRFTGKTLLLYGLTSMLLMNLICATTQSPLLVVVACLFLGFSKMAALMEVFIMWLFIWSKKGDTTRLYPFVYFTALSGLYFITWLTTKLAYSYDWRHSYLWIIILLLAAILLALVFVENHPLKRPLPLYQVDWIGLILLGACMMITDYIVVWGKVEDWFDSRKITMACFLLAITVLLFIERTLRLKRPLIDLHIFKRQTFRIGIVYFLLMGLFIPSTFQSAFSGSILHYETIDNIELNLYLIPGLLAGAIVCYIWYYKKLPGTPLIFAGFLAFTCYHIIMYNSFSLNFAKQDFWPPAIIKGFAMAVLYIAIGLYAAQKFDMNAVMTCAGILIIARSFLGSGVFTALYSYWFYTGRVQHYSYLAGTTDSNDALLQQGGAATLYRTLQEQSILTASKELTGYIIITGCIILSCMLLVAVFRGVNRLLSVLK